MNLNPILESIKRNNLFEEELGKEIRLSERKRVILLTIVASIPVIFFIFLILFQYDAISELDLDTTPVYWIVGILFFFALREAFISIAINKRIKDYPESIRYFNAFVEISFPSMIIFIISFYWVSPDVLSTPAVLLYLIIIILSILSLDIKLSIFTGTVAFVEYILIVIFLFSKYEAPDTLRIADLPYMYFVKGFFMLVSGFVAGFIAQQLRLRIFNSYHIISERDKAVNLFGQQVSKQIVDELLSNKTDTSSKRRFVCIMFLDIRGFTPLVEHKEPEEIIAYQNNIFGFMIEIINKYGGIVNQLLGDGFMATFGAPIMGENDCKNAVEASLEILDSLKRKIERSEIPETKIGIGLHAGFVVAGNVGTSFRKQYSITGNPVIISSRLEQLNKKFGSQILLSRDVAEKSGRDLDQYKSIGEVSIKGIEKPITVYQLV